MPEKGGRRQVRAGRRTQRARRCCGSLAGAARFAFNKQYSSTTSLLLPSLRKGNGESIDLIWNRSLGGAKLALGMSAVICGHINSLGFIFNFCLFSLFHFCDKCVKVNYEQWMWKNILFHFFWSLTKFLNVRGWDETGFKILHDLVTKAKQFSFLFQKMLCFFNMSICNVNKLDNNFNGSNPQDLKMCMLSWISICFFPKKGPTYIRARFDTHLIKKKRTKPTKWTLFTLSRVTKEEECKNLKWKMIEVKVDISTNWQKEVQIEFKIMFINMFDYQSLSYPLRKKNTDVSRDKLVL